MDYDDYSFVFPGQTTTKNQTFSLHCVVEQPTNKGISMRHNEKNLTGNDPTPTRMDEDTRQLKLRIQRTVSSGDGSVPMGSPSSNPTTTSTNDDVTLPSRIRSMGLSLCFGLICWHYPRYLILSNQTIVLKTPPYQKTSAGDIIVDFTLNEKVSDPPIISCKSRCVCCHTTYSGTSEFSSQRFIHTTLAQLLKWSGCYLPLLISLLHVVWASRRSTRTYVMFQACTVIAAFSMAMGLSEGTTQMLKIWIQRRRPSFYDLCGFDPTTVTCTASPEYIKEANLSFPSGHSSLSCCGMTFLVWYFLGKIKSRSPWQTMVITVLPWGWAIFVAGSRLVDKWHHASDVVAGLGLGFAASTVAYHIWYPPIWSSSAGNPRSVLEKTESILSAGNKLPSFHE